MRDAEPEDALLDKTLLQYLKQEWGLPSLNYARPLTQILGGYETSIYHFQLNTPPLDIPNTLVLRLFIGHAHAESIVQNAVAALGIPAPRVFLTCSDSSVLGGQFNIMEYMSGKPMIATQSNDLPELLGRMHARLHEFDPLSITKQLGTHGFGEERFSYEGWLNRKRQQIADAGCDWLTPGFQWLLRNNPVNTKPVICHGDFHPLNILMHEGRISGVLDWSGFRIADPAYDVASTKVVLSILAPVLRPDLLSSDFVERYLAAYQSTHPLDSDTLEYFKIARLILGLIDGAEGQTVWRHKDVVTQIDNILREHTGLDINIPNYL